MRVSSCIQRIRVITLLLLCVVTTGAQESAPDTMTRSKNGVVLITTYDDRGQPELQASGFFVTPELVVTNLHVIQQARRIQVRTFAGRVIDAQKVVGTDARSDLALLRLPEACPNVVALEVDYQSPREGDLVTVISNPQGSPWKVTRGTVGLTWEFTNLGNRIQISAAIRPGSSGAPVLNQQGQVVAIAAMYLKGDDELSFAVPAENLKPLQAMAQLGPSHDNSAH